MRRDSFRAKGFQKAAEELLGSQSMTMPELFVHMKERGVSVHSMSQTFGISIYRIRKLCDLYDLEKKY